MEIADLGRLLRHRRTAAGRTIASVAADAGLSVPYIANLENGRGNPTLSAVASLATALGAHLRVELADDAGDGPRRGEVEGLPDSLVQFARGARFSAEADRLAAATGAAGAGSVKTGAVRERLLDAMAGMASLSPRPLSELDWHRILDAVVLVTRESARE